MGMRSAEPEKPIFNMEYSEHLKAELARLQTRNTNARDTERGAGLGQ